MRSGIDPAANAATLVEYITEAASKNADIIFTPEMSGLLDRDRARAAQNIVREEDELVLARAREAASQHDIWVALGSLAIQSPTSDKWLNRSFLISPTGEIVARYDKIHLFDVDLDGGESWRESAAYEAGGKAIIVPVGQALLGLSICYDVRFASLYTALTDAGANILAVPAAFTVPTGKAHWKTLLRARAIEAGAFVVAAAQSGKHEDGRETYGHSSIIDPWGRVLLDMKDNLGVGICEIDLAAVAEVRGRVPAVANRRGFVLGENPQ
ncbi:carbon-nitrogen hydrolase family protein [Parasphingorhabdus halotolerans]|nr:carbon-nitrogen hydrolase family protein [Parasphingorhabdus halotolerans]